MNVKIIGTALTSEKGLITDTVISDCAIIKEAKFLGIWALNCPYWLLTDYACKFINDTDQIVVS